MTRVVCLATCCSLLVGCAPALRQPPTLRELAGPGADRAATDVDRLLAEAERSFFRLTLESVRQASKSWLEAAAADDAEATPASDADDAEEPAPPEPGEG